MEVRHTLARLPCQVPPRGGWTMCAHKDCLGQYANAAGWASRSPIAVPFQRADHRQASGWYLVWSYDTGFGDPGVIRRGPDSSGIARLRHTGASAQK